MGESIRVLFLAADSSESDWALRLDRELRDVQQSVSGGLAHYEVDIVPALAVRTTDLQAALLRHAPQVVHFSGHGSRATGIVMDDGEAVSTEALVGLFRALQGSVQVVLVNACNTLTTAEALSAVVDHAIGMNTVITDAAASVFSPAFYRALTHGRTVANAFDLAVNELQIRGFRESHIPQLRTRDGADPEPLRPRDFRPSSHTRAVDTPDRQLNEVGVVDSSDAIEFVGAEGPGGAAGGRASEMTNRIETLKTTGKLSFITRRA